jgi:hypothetical protein
MPRLARLAIPCLLVALVPTVRGDELLPPDRPLAEAIDHYVAAGLQEEGVAPVPRADDATLVRRLYLDLAGRTPSPREARDFAESTAADKTAQLVDRLAASPEYVDQLAREFDVFMTNGDGSLREYLRTALRERYGWDDVFRDVLLADPDDDVEKLAYDFLKRRVADTDKLTNEVSVVFFGINVSCMKCHDHPLVAGWYQDHFFGMKSFFDRSFLNGDHLAERDRGIVEYQTVEGETRAAKLMFLTGTVVDEPEPPELSKDEQKALKDRLEKFKKEKKPLPKPDFSRREQLVKLVLDEGQSDYFAKAVVNRVWHLFLGHGLVMPLDQMHEGNPPSHPELLDWLARDLREHDWDLHRLVRGIVLSDVYARGSRWEGDIRPDPSLFAVANVRPLTPTQYARALSLAARDPEEFDGDLSPEQIAEKSKAAANAGNANWFQQPGEAFAIGADEALRITNDPNFENGYLKAGLFNRLKQIEEPGEIVDLATRSILGREPTADEREVLAQYLGQRDDRREAAIQQVMWALLASTEMRFNH